MKTKVHRKFTNMIPNKTSYKTHKILLRLLKFLLKNITLPSVPAQMAELVWHLKTFMAAVSM